MNCKNCQKPLLSSARVVGSGFCHPCGNRALLRSQAHVEYLLSKEPHPPLDTLRAAWVTCSEKERAVFMADYRHGYEVASGKRGMVEE